MLPETVMGEYRDTNGPGARNSAGTQTPPGGRTVWSNPALLCGVLLVLVWAAFGMVLRNGFVNFDDDLYVTSNAQVRSGLTWDGLRWAFRANADTANWHPLTWISQMLDCQFFGLQPWGHHLTSLLLHSANVVLLFLLLRAMTGATWRGFAVAALFGVHPSRVESVAWVAERKDVLSTLFWLLTVLAYHEYCIASKTRNSKSKIWYGAALVYFGLGLMSKPMLVTLPLVLLLLDYWPLKRSEIFPAESSGGLPRRDKPGGTACWPRLVLEKWPFFLLAAVSAVITFVVQRGAGAMKGVSALPVSWRIENAIISYCRYLGKLFDPVDLSVFYPRQAEWPVGSLALAGAVLVGVTVAVVLMRRERPYLAVGWFWYVGALLPVIGLVQVGEQAMADRYLYVPAIGIFVMAAWAVHDFVRKWRYREAVCCAAGFMVLLTCVGMTRRQVSYWENSRTLFEHAGAVTEENYVADWHLGDYFAHHGTAEQAADMYRKAIVLAPGCIQAYNSLGILLLGQGRVDEAIGQFQEAIRRDPRYTRAHGNLGVALCQKGLTDRGIAEFEEAIRLDPAYADAHYNLGTVLEAAGHVDEA
ncbi:MAG TPA: tetratricopeptide repeat protein, partial [Candidatus Cybelea sp.]|nr:tetratricopeptide repeat protein [Candidatus Cybelea sp.]